MARTPIDPASVAPAGNNPSPPVGTVQPRTFLKEVCGFLYLPEPAPTQSKGCYYEKSCRNHGKRSDWSVVSKGCQDLKEYGVPFEAHVCSCHRTPTAALRSHRLQRKTVLVSSLLLPEWPHTSPVYWPHTPPCRSSVSRSVPQVWANGRAARNSPDASGIPVATVAINGAANAAFLLFRCWRCRTMSSPPSWKQTSRRWLKALLRKTRNRG